MSCGSLDGGPQLAGVVLMYAPGSSPPAGCVGCTNVASTRNSATANLFDADIPAIFVRPVLGVGFFRSPVSHGSMPSTKYGVIMSHLRHQSDTSGGTDLAPLRPVRLML